MLKFISRIAPVAVMALVAVGFAHFTRADDAPATQPAVSTGSIVVTVNDADGKPVPDCTVSLYVAKKAKKPKKPANEAADDGSGAGTDAPKKKPGMMGPPLQTGTTDKDGNFTFTNVPMGNYSVSAELKGTGRGRSKVALNSPSESVTITLKAPTPKPDAGSTSQPAPSN